jgi:hypothetical protein
MLQQLLAVLSGWTAAVAVVVVVMVPRGVGSPTECCTMAMLAGATAAVAWMKTAAAVVMICTVISHMSHCLMERGRWSRCSSMGALLVALGGEEEQQQPPAAEAGAVVGLEVVA